jgi:hypothetical protein
MPRSAADGFQSAGSAPAPSVNKEDADTPFSVSASRTLRQGLPPEHLPPLSINTTNARPEPWVSKSEFFTSPSTEQKWEELYNSAEHFVQRESPPQSTKSRTSEETYWETQPKVAAFSSEIEYRMPFRSALANGVDESNELASEDEFGRWPTLPEEQTYDDADDGRRFDEWKRMQRLHAEQRGIAARYLWSEPPS